MSGTLYGTTGAGGASNNGTVFQLTGSTETVLHSFQGYPYDGAFPQAALTNINGSLYGTTYSGGAYKSGTIFSITTSGIEKVLYSFGKGADGGNPYADLIARNGILLGTTVWGGIYNCGTLFNITTGGTEKVLYNFGYNKDGCHPYGTLTLANDSVYGTTQGGGVYKDGTIFSFATGGEKVLHNFGSGIDGSHPWAPRLMNIKGILYGTTLEGGSKCLKQGGCGTVFSITTSGKERALYSFSGGANDGANPQTSLTNVSGTLFSTTDKGGKYSNSGTVFSVTTTGTEKVLYSFGKGIDGRTPAGPMIYERGKLVGTTYAGGAYGYGTVFTLTP